MVSPDLKDTILSSLAIQRKKHIEDIASLTFSFNNLEEYKQYIEGMIFSEEDILDSSLKSLGLTVDDIDPNDFRDYQHETVEICIAQFANINIPLDH